MKQIITIILLLLFLISCSTETEETKQQPTSALFQKGVTMTPGADFNAFFDNALQLGNIISWQGDWNELSTENSAPHVLATLSKTKKYEYIIGAQFFTQSTGKLLRELDEQAKQEYKDAAVAFAKMYKPKYLAFGIEINILYEKSPDDFAEFVELYDEVYTAVKQASPDTKVFTIFQLEYMKKNNEWQLLNQFKTDIAAFTTYPFILSSSVSNIPSDYYQEIAAQTTKPVAFTEIGWQNAEPEFISLFFEQIKPMNPEFVIWSFLYDQNVQEPFSTMGLLKSDGTKKQGWNEWVKG